MYWSFQVCTSTQLEGRAMISLTRKKVTLTRSCLQYPCPAYQPQIDAGTESSLLTKSYSGPRVGFWPTPVRVLLTCSRRVKLGPAHRTQYTGRLDRSRKPNNCRMLYMFNDFVCALARKCKTS